MRKFFYLLWVAAFCTACIQAPVDTISNPETGTVTVDIRSEPLIQSENCHGQFIAHDLPHITAEAVARVVYFFSNGSGLAVNDLDNDGDIDIVMGNLLGDNHIFWNEGEMKFRTDVLVNGSLRDITTVDVNGDGLVDIVATARIGDVRYWRNTGENMGTADQFVQDRLLGVDALAYSLNWADLDVDGDLDLVTGSYDVSLEKQMGELYKETGQSGVFVYQQQADNTFIPTRLAEKAQALALEVSDIDMDGRLDIMVGNDFDTRDQVWLNRDGTWAEATPFTTTTHSTMSFDTGDINNDGSPEFFAADMHPYSDAPEIMEQWQPVIDTMPHNLPADDPQRMFNVLQVRDEAGQYTNLAAQTHVVSDGSGHSIEATGWSWSGKFGDLNQDGFLDFYIVNGMAAQEIFSHLPNDELIEENQAFRNKVGQSFVLAPEWDLGSTRGGRSMSMADLDGDGDLDIVVNNLRAPAQIFENQLCEGAALLMDVRWPNSGNTYAIGTQLALHTSTGTYTRRVRVSSGYLSGDAARVHFGLPVNSEIEMLEVRWPDGEVSTVHGLTHQEILQIARQ